ncbi:iron-sulfur cluster carrier protein ApbC [Rhodospirillaceae bacterium KN72]|uniref:Iron-sulfur cluster carrier protein n=1 Tax=Pacificispira spongiicola TaxID=2729598 RepID=A0A7Y0DWN6_9PROT|nr:iron-sulfur cluster carrier protein ApbC [Pacificispira spongiicola]NMM43000.1 iron-sulfur cluster carrier protein ApbC [Pacificispira spongiicola]
MADITEDSVKRALAEVAVPGGGDVVSSGMISGIAIRDRMVQVSLDIDDPSRAAEFEPLRRAVEEKIGALPSVLSASAVLTAESKKPAAATAAPSESGGKGVSGIRHIIAVASGKGGVGKSTTAVNLALALKQLGLSVGILDADVYGPSLPRMMGLAGQRPTSPDGKTLVPLEAYGTKVMSIGFLVAEDQPVVWRGPMVMGALQQMMDDVQWGALDVLVVDMPPGTGDAQLSLSQKVPLAGAVIVSTPQDIALLDARKGLNMFRKVDVPVLGIVENMSMYICPNCGHEAHIFGHGGAKAEASKLETPFLGEIPLDIEIRETSDGGTPIVETQPDSPHAAAYLSVAQKIREALDGGQASRAAPRFVDE